MATVSLRTSRASFTLAHLDEQITAVFFYFVAAGLERRKLIQITVRVLMDSPAPNPDLRRMARNRSIPTETTRTVVITASVS